MAFTWKFHTYSPTALSAYLTDLGTYFELIPISTYSHTDRRRLSILTKADTILGYCGSEFKLVWTLLKYSERKTSEADHDASLPLFILSETILESSEGS
jgi:hypothetical protein